MHALASVPPRALPRWAQVPDACLRQVLRQGRLKVPALASVPPAALQRLARLQAPSGHVDAMHASVPCPCLVLRQGWLQVPALASALLGALRAWARLQVPSGHVPDLCRCQLLSWGRLPVLTACDAHGDLMVV